MSMQTKQKVVTKDQIAKVLFEGGRLRRTHWDAKVTLLALDTQTNKYIELGTVRFDTYLQLDLREIEMKLPLWNNDYTINEEASPFERLRRYDPWCGYDEYQLKPKVLELMAQGNDFAKYFKARIWRKNAQ